MTSPSDQLAPIESVTSIAARWFARRRSGEMSVQESAALQEWLAADPAHRQAYRNLQIAWSDVETMRDDPAMMAMRQQAMDETRGPSRAFLIRAVAACVTILILAGVVAMTPALMWNANRYSDQEYRTSTGQRATVTLPDGSEVTLNTDSLVRTRTSKDRRLVQLVRGQAFFRVAKDKSHPFVVTAAGRTVTALGTAFDVRVDDGRSFQVTLVEGKVRVEAPLTLPIRREPGQKAPLPRTQATEMVAGTQLRASSDIKWDLAPANVARETSWMSGQLIFYSAPLSHVVAELNRYSDRKLVIDNAAYARRPISGAFRVGDVESFARGLETYRLARVESETAEAIVLAAP